MKRTTTIVLAVFIALSMTACDALDAILQVNVFAPFAAVSASEIKNADAATLLELSGSTSFYATLAESEETKAAVLTTIGEAMASAAPSSPEYQELAVLAAQIELQTTPAGDLINNIGDLLQGFIGGEDVPDGEEQDLAAMVQSLLPEAVYAADGETLDETSFIAMVDALVNANDYFVLLGGAIGDDGFASEDISAGDVAQSAIVCAIIASIEPPAGSTTGEYLYDLLSDPDAPEATAPDLETVLGDENLMNLLAAAGLDSLFSGDEAGM